MLTSRNIAILLQIEEHTMKNIQQGILIIYRDKLKIYLNENN